MLLFGDKKVSEGFSFFLDLTDKKIDIFGESMKKLADEKSGEKPSDEEFTASYVDGMHNMLAAILEEAASDLQNRGSGCEAFMSALDNPERYGFRFKNPELTLGKIYLYYIWGLIHKKAPKSDCIRLEKHLMQRIGQQCVKYGFVN